MTKGLIQELVEEANKPVLELVDKVEMTECDYCFGKGKIGINRHLTCSKCKGTGEMEYIPEDDNDFEQADFSGSSDELGYANDR